MTLFDIAAGRFCLCNAADNRFVLLRSVNKFGGPRRRPIRIGIVASVVCFFLSGSPVLTAPASPQVQAQMPACVTQCRIEQRDKPFCEAVCDCVLRGLEERNMLSVAPDRMSAVQNDEWIKLVRACVGSADSGGAPPADTPSAATQAPQTPAN